MLTWVPMIMMPTVPREFRPKPQSSDQLYFGEAGGLGSPAHDRLSYDTPDHEKVRRLLVWRLATISRSSFNKFAW